LRDGIGRDGRSRRFFEGCNAAIIESHIPQQTPASNFSSDCQHTAHDRDIAVLPWWNEFANHPVTLRTLENHLGGSAFGHNIAEGNLSTLEINAAVVKRGHQRVGGIGGSLRPGRQG
jgi:hypothetical protein